MVGVQQNSPRQRLQRACWKISKVFDLLCAGTRLATLNSLFRMLFHFESGPIGRQIMITKTTRKGGRQYQ